MVRQFQFERSQQVMLLVDVGRLMQSKIGDWSKLDHAINSALSLAQVALRVGDRVGLMTFGARVKQFLPPEAGAAQLRAILELLHGVVAEPVEPNYRRAVDTLLGRMNKRALVVIFTDLAQSAGLPDLVVYSARMRHRHLPLVLAITILLIPVSLIGIVLLLVAGLFGWIAVGLEVGKRLAEAFKWELQAPAAAGMGTLVLTLVVGGLGLFPCVGWLAPFLVASIGLGAVMLTRFGSREYASGAAAVTAAPKPKLPPPPPPEPPAPPKPPARRRSTGTARKKT